METRQRAVWADVAKGVCILLVVLWHTVNKSYLAVEWTSAGPFPVLWGVFGDALMTLRMPLFFAISGMFALSAYRKPWAEVIRSRVAKFLYLYLAWMLVHTAILWFTPSFDTLSARSVGEFAEQFLITPPNLWYLYALALYFAAAKLLKRIPIPVLLGAAALLAVVTAAGVFDTPGNRGSLLQNFVFFLMGLHLRPLAERIAQTTTWRRTAIIGLVYGTALAAMLLLSAQRIPTVWTLVSLLAMVFGLSAAPLLGRLTLIGDSLAWLGRRTLPIYVIHMPLLALLHTGVSDLLGSAPLVVAALYPALVTGGLVAVCLLIDRILPSWLTDLPQLTRRDRWRSTRNRVAKVSGSSSASSNVNH
ncbi:acyltransferase family protein [Herbidospora mongoliensis]|uniref:acyltransferase family protein n=1 Tax=Herbidospora mongoliensis TaxID=688067 RepID=UPI0008377D5D|nr:acyltransferase family protein [Herbidospora mongoliensis]